MAGRRSENNINIPIQQTDLSIFDDTMCSMKELFVAELKKMDDEMNKIRFLLILAIIILFGSDLTRVYAQSSSLDALTSVQDSCENQGSSKSKTNWDTLTNSPLVEVDGCTKTLKLQFDVSQFDPAEVCVNVKKDTLVISASHEEKNNSNSLSRQYHREFQLPKGVDPCSVCSTLSKDGILIVQAPLPEPQKGSSCSSKCSRC